LVPITVTEPPMGADAGAKPLMFGAGTTVKLTPLLLFPLAVTTTLPVVAPVGTVTAMLVPFQLVTLAVVPLKVKVPDPWVEPKFVPLIVTAAPTAPVVIDREVITGGTVKFIPLVFTPLAYTTTLPVDAPLGTVTTMLVALQLVTLAVDPLNVTPPDP
jgi:hypothetical protein